MKTFIVIVLLLVAAIFAAEFAAGVVHWFEDAYIREDSPILGQMIGKPNVIHHHFPRYFTQFTWWHSSRDLIIAAGLVVLAAWALGVLSWPVWVFAIVSANANEIHKWTHRTRKENGRVISFFQDIGILQTARHHALHHTDPKNSHYCTITNYMNPVLDGVHFWERTEWLLAKTVGLKRRADTSLHGSEKPAWIEEYRARRAKVAVN